MVVLRLWLIQSESDVKYLDWKKDQLIRLAAESEASVWLFFISF